MISGGSTCSGKVSSSTSACICAAAAGISVPNSNSIMSREDIGDEVELYESTPSSSAAIDSNGIVTSSKTS